MIDGCQCREVDWLYEVLYLLIFSLFVLIIDISYIIDLKGQITELLHPTLVIYIYNQKVRMSMRDLRSSGHRMKLTKIIISILIKQFIFKLDCS